MFAAIAASLVFVVGCTSADERVARTFRFYPTLAKHVRQADELTVYEGLPHPEMDAERFEKELKLTGSIEINGHRFYRTPVAVSDETLERLRSLTTQKNLFRPFQAAKACGGFHPDWCLVWADDPEAVYVHFCFGCDEVAAFVDDERQMLCEMENDKPFKSVLDPLRINLPAQGPDLR